MILPLRPDTVLAEVRRLEGAVARSLDVPEVVPANSGGPGLGRPAGWAPPFRTQVLGGAFAVALAGRWLRLREASGREDLLALRPLTSAPTCKTMYRRPSACTGTQG